MRQLLVPSHNKPSYLLIPLLVLMAVGIGWVTAQYGFMVPGLILGALIVGPLLYSIFQEPRVGFISFVIYCFLFTMLEREVSQFPFFIYGVEAFLVLTWLATLFHTNKDYDWSNITNEINVIAVIWILITILQLFNPAGTNPLGWMLEFRYPLLWILTVPLCMVMFNRKKDLDTFLIVIIAMSFLATLNGIKQITIGLSDAEQLWLNTKGYVTHMIFGQMRVFSFYSDASQFGSSQAQMFIIALVLALGPFKMWKKVLCGIAAVAFLYGESISGTRGALITLVVGVIVVIFINKNVKVILIGVVLVVTGYVFLQYTSIGHSKFEIRRMRSALRTDDASLNTRLGNQEKLANYLDSRPFGGGVGAIGFTGRVYNKGTYLATIPPDSYWVKIWAEYGIVGFVIWISMMMYIIGKSCGIVWNTKDRGLRFKLTALTAGFTGIIVSSYGNELMNAHPSSMILFVSWAFIFLGPKLDREAQQVKEAHV